MKLVSLTGDPMDRTCFPADPWRLVELVPPTHETDMGLAESLFSVANGYLGMRGNPEEGRPVHEHGTFINGFHETWPIHHAEAAYGFARTGQTIVNVPDAKVMKLYADDEPFVIGRSEVEQYERSLDFRDGVLRRSLVWRTPAGKRMRVQSSRMVSMEQRHLAVLSLEVTMLEGDAPLVISSQLLNRLDGRDEYHAPGADKVAAVDPRKASAFSQRVLLPRLRKATAERMQLGYRCTNSNMTVAVAADHVVSSDGDYDVTVIGDEEDVTKVVFRIQAKEGQTIRIDKLVSYHTSTSLPVRELADRCKRTLDRAAQLTVAEHHRQQREWFDQFWINSDVEIASKDPDAAAVQQAIRFNLLTLAQAASRADNVGIPAKGVTGSGYEGHYFWDSEIYVAPFLSYTMPNAARNLMLFRSGMLPAARARAVEMSQSGALFPWRTINGEEASAYYAAGTAQVHIDADIAYALMQYVRASGDVDFLVRHGVAILVETARLYADLGFWRGNGSPIFHIHGVTGPDEYTAVNNNNLFTNVMARFTLEQAALAVAQVQREFPADYERLVHQLKLNPEEPAEWQRCADGMNIPYDEGLEIHPQDDAFLEREVWDLSRTPAELRPLLLHYHPLVIYRFQVLKQTDVVMALFLQGHRFSADEKRRDFEYYDPITTGDSTLSAVVQSVIAAEVGYHEMAYTYFMNALYVDLADLHDNTVDGLHIASAGGVWAALVNGFSGMRDQGEALSFDPRLPLRWDGLSYPLTWHGTRVRVTLNHSSITFAVEAGVQAVPIIVRGNVYTVSPGNPVTVQLETPLRIDGVVNQVPQTGGVRHDGSRITSGVPEPRPWEAAELEV